MILEQGDARPLSLSPLAVLLFKFLLPLLECSHSEFLPLISTLQARTPGLGDLRHGHPAVFDGASRSVQQGLSLDPPLPPPRKILGKKDTQTPHLQRFKSHRGHVVKTLNMCSRCSSIVPWSASSLPSPHSLPARRMAQPQPTHPKPHVALGRWLVIQAIPHIVVIWPWHSARRLICVGVSEQRSSLSCLVLHHLVNSHEKASPCFLTGFGHGCRRLSRSSRSKRASTTACRARGGAFLNRGLQPPTLSCQLRRGSRLSFLIKPLFFMSAEVRGFICQEGSILCIDPCQEGKQEAGMILTALVVIIAGLF